jgi:hypothetical protein
MDKLKQSFIDLDQARCDEKWQDISELAKKYKKYHPQESGEGCMRIIQ